LHGERDDAATHSETPQVLRFAVVFEIKSAPLG
jgi:hypothetical protein